MTRRDVLLVVISVVGGPLVAGIVFAVVGSLISGLLYGSTEATILVEYLPVVLMAAYFYGAIPGLIGAVLVAALFRRLTTLQSRLLTGAIVGVLTTLPIVGLASSFAWQSIVVTLAVLPGGALAGLVCVALVEWIDPVPAAPGAVS